MMRGVKLNNILTLSRIFLTPIIPLAFFNGFNIFGLSMFVILCMTDLLDGYYARKWNTESYIGRVLDPIADKCLSITMLFMLGWMQKLTSISALCTCVIILRELFVSGVRTFNPTNLKSSKISKYKTLFINCAIFLSLVEITFARKILSAEIFLIIGTVLAVASALRYGVALIDLLKNEK